MGPRYRYSLRLRTTPCPSLCGSREAPITATPFGLKNGSSICFDYDIKSKLSYYMVGQICLFVKGQNQLIYVNRKENQRLQLMDLNEFNTDTIIEPFRIRSVEPIRFTTMEERKELLKNAGYNPFLLKAKDVLIDLLTDSGTGAMSSGQWAGIISSDESYAGSSSYYRLENAVQDITAFKHVIPTHQGRAAENILFTTIAGEGDVVPRNTHFDTTRAHVEHTGAEARDLVIEEGKQPRSTHPFKGNMDLQKLEKTVEEVGEDHIPV